MISRKQREEITNLMVDAIQKDVLNFDKLNRSKRREFYKEIVKKYGRGKQILIEFLKSMRKSEHLSWIGSRRSLSELEEVKNEMTSDIEFIKSL
jgi:hypothetical protein